MLHSILRPTLHNTIFSAVKRELRTRPKYINVHNIHATNNKLQKENTILKLEIDKLKIHTENMNDRIYSLLRTRSYCIIYICTYVFVKIFW
jgi:cell division protein FtsB